MSFTHPIASLYLVAIPAVLYGQPPRQASHPFRGTTFTLQLPPDLVSKDESPQMMDFNVYWVYSGDRRLFGIYEGNAPNLGRDHRDGAGMDAIHLGKLEANMSRTNKADGTISAQYLVQTRYEEWPSLLHIWYTDQPAAEAKAIDAILQTLQLNEPKH